VRRAIRLAVRVFADSFNARGPVAEIGSFYPPGYQDLCDLRPFFRGVEFFGCDLRRGLGVDLIEDAQALSFADNSIGTIMLFEILEHLPHPEKAIAEAWRVLDNHGLLALSVPFTYRVHGLPSDYWRFTSSGIHTLLSAFSEKIVFAVGPRLKPAFIFAVAAKTASSEFAEHSTLFRSKVHQAFHDSRLQGHISILKERARDFLGHLLGRADVGVTFFDPNMEPCFAYKDHEYEDT
jgi:SAM-dependent methyltransferase